MKIVLAAPLYPPEIGGPATYAEILVRELPKHGIRIELVKFSDVRHLPKLLRHYAYYRRVLRAARDADLVFALDPVSVGFPAMCAARKAHKPFFVKVVGDYAWEQGVQRFRITAPLDEFVKITKVPFSVRLLRTIEVRVARNATRVIVPSEYLKKIVIQWGVPAGSVEVIHNAVTLPSPGILPRALADVPRPLVVSVGRLVPWKHFDGLIDAIDRLHQEQTSAFLVIVGDGPERKNLERYAREKIGNHYFFTGKLSHADALAVMKSANVVALNSSYEGLSHVLIEAQMLGVPVVATLAGGNSEVVINGESGLLVPLGDTPAFADALGDAILDGFIRPRLVAGGEKSSARFSESEMIQKTTTLLKAP